MEIPLNTDTPKELPLGKITPTTTVNREYCVRGTVVFHRGFNEASQLDAVQLSRLDAAKSDGAESMLVEFVGTFVKRASAKIELGCILAIKLGKVQVLEVPSKSDDMSWKRYKLRFSEGVTMRVEAGDEDEDEERPWETFRPLKKRKKQDQSAPQAAQVSQPHTQPPATSTFSAALSLTAVAPAAQTASIAAAQLARVPAPSPPPPELRVSSTSAGSLKRPASEPFAGKRSAKRQARLANQWGLTVSKSSTCAVFKAGTSVEYRTIGNPPTKNCRDNSIIAVAKIIKPAAPSRGTDWSLTLGLIDPTHEDEPTKCIIFGKGERDLPKLEDGDVIVLQRMNWSNDISKGNYVGYNPNARWRVFTKEELTADAEPTFAKAMGANRVASCGPQEWSYAQELYEACAAKVSALHIEPEAAVDAKAVSAALRKGTSTVQRNIVEVRAVEMDLFCDMVVELVRYWSPHALRIDLQASEAATAMVTDYTSNADVFQHDRDQSRPDLTNGSILQVSLFGSQAKNTKRVEDGDRYVMYLQNVRIKNNMHGLLEATMAQDFQYPEKCQVLLLTDARGRLFKGMEDRMTLPMRQAYDKLVARRQQAQQAALQRIREEEAAEAEEQAVAAQKEASVTNAKAYQSKSKSKSQSPAPAIKRE